MNKLFKRKEMFSNTLFSQVSTTNRADRIGTIMWILFQKTSNLDNSVGGLKFRCLINLCSTVESISLCFTRLMPIVSDNFKKREADEVDSLNVPYDYGSIMHYGLKDFSDNRKPTLRVSIAYRAYTARY